MSPDAPTAALPPPACPDARSFSSERLLAAALDHTSQPVCVAPAPVPGAPAVVVHANPSYLDLFCARAADIAGRAPGWITGPLSDGAVAEAFAECARSGRPQRIRTIEHRLDGGAFRARWRLDPVTIEGVVTHVVAAPQDVSTEDRRRRRLQALEAWTACLDEPRGRRALERTRDALAAAVAVVVDDLGDSSVVLDGLPPAVHRRHGGAVADEEPTDPASPRTRRWFDIGAFGTITMDLLPGARELFDHRLMRTLAERSARSLAAAGSPVAGAIGRGSPHEAGVGR